MGKLDLYFKNWFMSRMRTFFLREYESAICREEPAIDKPYPIQDVAQTIHELDDALRIPFSMYLGGCTYQEIATRLNLPLGTVKSRVYFAREEFENRMKKREYRQN